MWNHLATIMIPLLNEGVEVWRPVQAEQLPGGRYRIVSENSNPEDARFWEVPFEPHRRPHFIASLLDLLGDWQLCYVWRHMGSWPSSVDSLRINDVVEFQILHGLGLPLGTADVVEFSRKELEKL